MSATPGIGALQLPMIDGTSAASSGGGAAGADKVGSGGSGFGDVLRGKLEDLNNSQATADTAAQELATGKTDDIARSMMQVQQANISLQLATQLRNKAIDAYQEILRMQV